MKNIYFYIIIVTLVLGLVIGGYVLTSPKRVVPNVAKTNEVILYYGNSCPHCKVVEGFLDKNATIEAKLQLTRKEVYDNQENAMDMESKANICKLATGQGIGVPFLYFKGECLIGSDPIINFLTEKTK